ncbi:MAG: AraC family transcriptional regulator, partial [Phycisphaerae bacterium]
SSKLKDMEINAPQEQDNEQPHHPDYHRRIESACRLLEQQIDIDVPLDQVAKAACLSTFHFHRLFRGLTGETVRGYVRRIRLEQAAHRLTSSTDEILRIALDVGYNSHEAFTRAFQKRFEMPPSQFREEKRKVMPADTRNRRPIEVRIETREPCTVAAVRHVGPYHQVGDAWKKLIKWGWSRMIFGKPPEMFGLCYDDPDITENSQIRYDACLVVRPDTKVKGDIEQCEVEGGIFAVTIHHGPYERLGETYARLCAEIVDAAIGGRRFKLGLPPSIEKYLNDPRKTKPEDLQTEIWMPIISKTE